MPTLYALEDVQNHQVFAGMVAILSQDLLSTAVCVHRVDAVAQHGVLQAAFHGAALPVTDTAELTTATNVAV
jgi:hypothetical protein